jgi:S1-C subfamily serine protease
VVREAAPAVVNIYARKGRPADPFLSDPFYRFFFEGFGGRPLPRSVPENSLGSGVIVAADGLIVTNHHVIKDADEIMVVLSDRREFRADVIGADQAADLALLDIEAENLPARCRWAIPTGWRWATWCLRSATRSASGRP